MATNDYWEGVRRLLFLAEFGSLARARNMTEEALIAGGPSSANIAAVECMVLGLKSETEECLRFVPRLAEALNNKALLQHLPVWDRKQREAYLRIDLHVGEWLRSGSMDPMLARNAYPYALSLNLSSSRPNVLDLMLLSAESDNPKLACEIYRKHERKPIALPPTNVRFAANPRSVLYACLASESEADRDMARRSLDAFRKSVCATEDLHSHKFMFRDQLARVLRAAHRALGLEYSLDFLIPLLR